MSEMFSFALTDIIVRLLTASLMSSVPTEMVSELPMLT